MGKESDDVSDNNKDRTPDNECEDEQFLDLTRIWSKPKPMCIIN